jgi:integrase
MNASGPRVLTYAEVPGFLDLLEKRISEAIGFQWRELDRGDLGVWIQSPKGALELLIIRQDLADEFRAHEGIRCAILDSMAEGTSKQIAGMETSSTIYRLELVKSKGVTKPF